MNQEVIKLIKQSFLTEAAKNELIKTYQKYGETDTFFKKFDLLFREEIANRTAKSTKAMAKLEDGTEKARQNFLAKKDELEKKLKEVLASNDPVNLKRANTIWGQYYKKNRKLYSEYQNELEKISKDSYLSIIG